MPKSNDHGELAIAVATDQLGERVHGRGESLARGVQALHDRLDSYPPAVLTIGPAHEASALEPVDEVWPAVGLV